ncbi:AAA family ATPase [Alterisphingorhabdus coralli]|uniref:AAA family ATPase n=1 Tax=Alterisphingorhabdus coralli TaxID=3071408 RepID=A0AA97F3T8_9SPHN|nr:AAA family ATPase [Parasphingorhabdus sp. SCSIO 66989]WOE73779.1 AAA family ATPase [Parasphingorhabdus sp. SCSIO 66989]
MTRYSPLPSTSKDSESLLERASKKYDLGDIRRTSAVKAASKDGNQHTASGSDPMQALPSDTPESHAAVQQSHRPDLGDAPTQAARKLRHIDRTALREANFIIPDGPVSGLSEEFRIVKRQLLQNAEEDTGPDGGLARRILICSAKSGDGKTFCAVNLALSIAAERDYRVILVDADFAKPGVSRIFGLDREQGLMDALSNPDIAINNCIVDTDIPGFSVLPAGKQTNNDTEYLASSRTSALLAQLALDDPHRILIFDSPPALSASPASELANHVGQALMVVRADKTSESALSDALTLVARCPNIQLLLNGAKFSPTGRSFGSYYGYGEQ